MKKMLLICVGIMFCSLTSFGQYTLQFKSLPNASGLFKALPTFPDIRIPGFNWVPTDIGMSGKLPFPGNAKPSTLKQPKRLVNPKAQPTIFADPSNMPIIDLSKGYSSNLPIKEFSEDFPSNMPIVGVETLRPKARPGIYRYNGLGNYQHMFPGWSK